MAPDFIAFEALGRSLSDNGEPADRMSPEHAAWAAEGWRPDEDDANTEYGRCGECDAPLVQDGRLTIYCADCDTCQECHELPPFHDARCPLLIGCDHCAHDFVGALYTVPDPTAPGCYLAEYHLDAPYTDPVTGDHFEFCSDRCRDAWCAGDAA